jgi:hypothetical protein
MSQPVSLQPIDLAGHDETEGASLDQLMEPEMISISDLEVGETTTRFVPAA